MFCRFKHIFNEREGISSGFNYAQTKCELIIGSNQLKSIKIIFLLSVS